MILSPLLVGIINRTKAFFAGRKGQPLLQAYYDIARLFQKNVVYSRTTSWVFRAGPVAGLAAAVRIEHRAIELDAIVRHARDDGVAGGDVGVAAE